MPRSERPDTPRIVKLSGKDVEDVRRLLRLFAEPDANDGAVPAAATAGHGRAQLVARAQAELLCRRTRERHFDPELFGEPAWEILLALYIIEVEGLRFTTGKLAEFIAVPPSTVVRWIRALEESSLVERADHPTDRRIFFIGLNAKGRQALDSYFATVLGQDMSQS